MRPRHAFRQPIRGGYASDIGRRRRVRGELTTNAEPAKGMELAHPVAEEPPTRTSSASASRTGRPQFEQASSSAVSVTLARIRDHRRSTECLVTQRLCGRVRGRAFAGGGGRSRSRPSGFLARVDSAAGAASAATRTSGPRSRLSGAPREPGRRRARADRAPRVQAHVRLPDDRRRSEREGAFDLHRTRSMRSRSTGTGT